MRFDELTMDLVREVDYSLDVVEVVGAIEVRHILLDIFSDLLNEILVARHGDLLVLVEEHQLEDSILGLVDHKYFDSGSSDIFVIFVIETFTL